MMCLVEVTPCREHSRSNQSYTNTSTCCQGNYHPPRAIPRNGGFCDAHWTFIATLQACCIHQLIISLQSFTDEIGRNRGDWLRFWSLCSLAAILTKSNFFVQGNTAGASLDCWSSAFSAKLFLIRRGRSACKAALLHCWHSAFSAKFIADRRGISARSTFACIFHLI